MTKTEYINYAFANKLMNKLAWGYSLLTLKLDGDYTDAYMTIDNGKVYVIVDGEREILEGVVKDRPPLSIFDEVTVVPETGSCIESKQLTTVGVTILNYVLVEKPFGGKIKFISKDFDISKLVSLTATHLTDGVITVPEYKVFINACSYLEGYSRIVTVSATEKMMLPPEGIVELKKKLTKEYLAKYGPEWFKDTSRVVAFDKELKDYFLKWVEDDPANGALLSGNVKNNAMIKKYLTFSATVDFGGSEYIPESLLEGYPEDPAKLAALFNTSRSGLYSKGNETQKGGSTAKDVLRSTAAIKITENDCKVKYGKLLLVTEDNANSLVGRYKITSGKYTAIKDEAEANSYLGKNIEIRSPQYCKESKSNFCAVCSGDRMANYKDGVSLSMTSISAVITTTAMKAMHNTIVSTVLVDMNDIVK